VTADEEDAQVRGLHDALEVVPDLSRLTGSSAGYQQPVAGSELDHDDRRSSPYQVSHAAWAGVAAAVDHLACLRDSLFHSAGPAHLEARIRTHGQFSLVRGALENASRVVWMLEPDQADERLLRRLRLEWAESGMQAAVSELTGAPARNRDDLFSRLTALLQTTGLDPSKIKSRADYRTIVRAAGTHLAAGSTRHEVIWRACSALAHDDVRGTLGYPAGDELPGQGPGIARAQVTGSVPLLTTGALVAIQTIQVARRLYGKRAG
jgi:hypothetical protein